MRAEAGKPLQVYSGCDHRSEHLYRFVSAERVETVQDKRGHACSKPVSCRWRGSVPMAVVNGWR